MQEKTIIQKQIIYSLETGDVQVLEKEATNKNSILSDVKMLNSMDA
jgi:hypothetical protein